MRRVSARTTSFSTLPRPCWPSTSQSLAGDGDDLTKFATITAPESQIASHQKHGDIQSARSKTIPESIGAAEKAIPGQVHNFPSFVSSICRPLTDFLQTLFSSKKQAIRDRMMIIGAPVFSIHIFAGTSLAA
jgi:hypothetical protein